MTLLYIYAKIFWKFILLIREVPVKSKIIDLYKEYGYFLYALIVPAYIALFMILQSIITPDNVDYIVSYIPLDDMIPFCEWFILPYMMWYPFLLGIGFYLMFTDPDTFRRYLLYIATAFCTYVLISFIIPNGQNLRVDIDALGRKNFALEMLRGIYTVDPNTNVCPSPHVVGSIGVAFATFSTPRVKNIGVKVYTVIMAILISISTVFVKQHSLLDILVAIPYSIIFYYICFKLVRFKKSYEPVIKPKKR